MIDDRLLAPWTHPHPSSDKSQELKAAWAENKDCPEIPLFEFCESQSENIPKLSIYDDIESFKAKAHLLFMHLDISRFSTQNGITKKDTFDFEFNHNVNFLASRVATFFYF